MKIQVLGTGCPKCKKLYELADSVATECGVDYTIEKVEDINDIMAMGVMMTPALAVDGEVKVSGKVPSAGDIKKILSAS
ncbi:MAG: thioredoxin family protein [Planctomycetota bacterium]